MSPNFPSFREISYTGVLYVIDKATKAGYRPHDERWVNLGQGAPEVGEIKGAPPRLTKMKLDIDDHEYAGVSGEFALRQKVADLYNHLYRKNKSSQYTYENVSISGGGRIGLTRVVASLGNINLGHFLPDYTAYEEILSLFRTFVPIPILLEPEQGYQMPLDQIEKEILGRGLKALLLSNPCNPTGQVMERKKLEDFVNLCKFHECALIIDEFYSHYLFTNGHKQDTFPTVSAARYVEDVNEDPIIILDGLTKNWRYPGWRISWTLGPKPVIQALSSTGSFLDGGANHPLQQETLPLLDPDYTLKETKAIQRHFKSKRDYMLKRLKNMGIEVAVPPQGAFYIWANLAKLPPPLDQGFAFFEAALQERVIVVPGVFFDVNPEKRRKIARYSQYIRISFGPAMEALERGLDSLERVIQSHS